MQLGEAGLHVFTGRVIRRMHLRAVLRCFGLSPMRS